MTGDSPFPNKPTTSISREEVIEYLIQHQQRGYQIFQTGSGANSGFELQLDESRSIRIPNTNGEKVQVQSYSMNSIVSFVDCTSLVELSRAVDALAQQMIGVSWQRSPVSARVSSEAPATNLLTISRLIDGVAIEAVYLTHT
ncbi:MAG: hypothetical protein ACI8RU_000354 [Zhongshania aliphaticivorans]|jgi:hypothetical protein|uniref:hypothetical protein n=1 Tax=Zhongshania aliphaticivorans TaxID=1470434 RepID=UPI0039E69889